MSSPNYDQAVERALFILPYFAGSVAVALVIALLQLTSGGRRLQLLPFLERALRNWFILLFLSPLLLVAKCVAFFASNEGCINC